MACAAAVPAATMLGVSALPHRLLSRHAPRDGQRRLWVQTVREGHDVGWQRLGGWLITSGLRIICTRSLSWLPRTTLADPLVVVVANKLVTWSTAIAAN